MPTDPGLLPNPKLVACVERFAPGITRFEERTVAHGEARVWALFRKDALVAWLKRHRNRDKARRERRAYEVWLTPLRDEIAPFLGACDTSPALITGHVEGIRGDLAALEGADQRAVYREIGRFLARMHALEVDDVDEVPLPDALAQRCDAWIEASAGIVDDDLRDAARSVLEEPWPDDMLRVPCHRDLVLHNTIVQPTGDGGWAVRVIDFGQSRMDLWLSDLVKLVQLPEEMADGCFRALMEGYGRRLKGWEVDALVRLRLLHGLATWAWAADHGDVHNTKLGRRIVRSAMDAIDRDSGHGGWGGPTSW